MWLSLGCSSFAHVFQGKSPARQKQSPANLRGFAFSTSDGGDRGGPGPIRTRFMNSSRASYRKGSMVSGRSTGYPQVDSRLAEQAPRNLPAVLLEASSALLTDATDIPSDTVDGVVRADLTIRGRGSRAELATPRPFDDASAVM
jgi:hypothetical protein